MKKLLLSVIALTAMAISTNAQIIVRGISPASIAGNHPFTWADNWGSTPDFNIAGTFVQDTLAMCEDGTPGTSTTTIPHPLSQEACSALTNGSSVAGKIAVMYRGSCEFGVKALNAQNEGAVAVIIINRDPDPVGMGGGAQGANLTIPVVMVGSGPGQAITNAMLAGDVVMFLGNKVGILGDDMTINPEIAKIPTSAGVPSVLSNNIFDPAVRVFNYGNEPQTGVVINLKVNGPGTGGPSVYDNSITGLSVPVSDSAEALAGTANILPTLDLATLSDGEYFMEYTVSSDSTDEDPTDNMYSSSFTVNTNWLSGSRLDANDDPVHNTYPQNTDNPGIYEACMSFTNPDASEVMATGVKFVPSGDTSAIDMTGEEITFTIYEWSAPNDLATLVSPPVYSTVTYLAGNNDNQTVIFHPFEQAVPLVDDMVYLVCATSTAVTNVVFGYDNAIDYSGNEEYDILLAAPIQIAGTWFTGWAGTNAISLGLELKPNTVGLEENTTLEAVAFPNPTNDVINLRVNASGDATVTITDLAGKTVATIPVVIAGNAAVVNTSNLEAGAYIMTVATANGASTKLNIVKN